MATFREESENIHLVEKYLNENKEILSTLRAGRKVNVDRLATDKKNGATSRDIKE